MIISTDQEILSIRNVLMFASLNMIKYFEEKGIAIKLLIRS